MVGGPGFLEDIAEKIMQAKRHPHNLRKLFMEPIERELREVFAEEWAAAEGERQARRRAELRQRLEEGRAFLERRGIDPTPAPSIADLRRRAGEKPPAAPRRPRRGTKTVALEYLERKSAAAGDTFVFYAATWDGPDRAGEIIRRGAFANLDAFIKTGWIAASHDNAAAPIAAPVTATQDARGLLIEARWHQTPMARDWRTVVKERLAAGKSVSASIGYRVHDYEMTSIRGQPVRVLTNIELFEASIVNLPANPMAGVVSA
jgi:HK97 family phage prohead protease